MLSCPVNEKEYQKERAIKGEVLQATELIANEIIKSLQVELKEITKKLDDHERRKLCR